MEWTDLDQAYLDIFGDHPDLRAADDLGRPMWWCGTYRLERLSEDPSTFSSMSSGAVLEQDVVGDLVAEELTELEREILEFERSWWKHAGAKESAVRETFDMSSTRYYQVLQALIDKPAALAVDPMLVRRLQRLREARRAQRSATRTPTPR